MRTSVLEAHHCIPDTLEVVFDLPEAGLQVDGPREITVAEGDRFTAVVVRETRTDEITGWTYGVSHDARFLRVGDDPCDVYRPYVCGTDAGQHRIQPNFSVSLAVDPCEPGGPAGFISAQVISAYFEAQLPIARNSMIQIPYEVIRTPLAGGFLLRLEDGILCNAPSPATPISFTVDGFAREPSALFDARVLPRIVEGRNAFLRGDTDGDGRRNVTDAVFLSGWLFRQGDPIPDPSTLCGFDRVDGSLGCAESSPACGAA